MKYLMYEIRSGGERRKTILQLTAFAQLVPVMVLMAALYGYGFHWEIIFAYITGSLFFTFICWTCWDESMEARYKEQNRWTNEE